MSVLVEALTLVVRRSVPDAGFSLDLDAFRSALSRMETPPRHVVADPYLAAASFFSFEHLHDGLVQLCTDGVLEYEGDMDSLLALAQQDTGLIAPGPWVQCAHHRDGFTHAWSKGTRPGTLATPDGWTPECSQMLTPLTDTMDPERYLLLGPDSDGSMSEWLDFQSGMVFQFPTALQEREDEGT